MVRKEGFTGGGSPLTEKEKGALRQTLEPQVWLQPEVVQPTTTNPGVWFSQLVSKAELADGAWHRGYPGARSHEFVLALTNASKETLNKAYKTELELQRDFPLVAFDFQFRISPLSGEEKADLEQKGYKWVPPPAETALPNSL